MGEDDRAIYDALAPRVAALQGMVAFMLRGIHENRPILCEVQLQGLYEMLGTAEDDFERRAIQHQIDWLEAASED